MCSRKWGGRNPRELEDAEGAPPRQKAWETPGRRREEEVRALQLRFARELNKSARGATKGAGQAGPRERVRSGSRRRSSHQGALSLEIAFSECRNHLVTDGNLG